MRIIKKLERKAINPQHPNTIQLVGLTAVVMLDGDQGLSLTLLWVLELSLLLQRGLEGIG